MGRGATGRRPLPRLGELERRVLVRLWSQGPADVKTVHADVGQARGITVNTIQSTLERLYRKGLAERTKVGRAHRYMARISRREWVARSLEELLGAVPGTDPAVLLSAFVDLAERAGAGRLDVLERLVRERRRSSRGGGKDRSGGGGS